MNGDFRKRLAGVEISPRVRVQWGVGPLENEAGGYDGVLRLVSWAGYVVQYDITLTTAEASLQAGVKTPGTRHRVSVPQQAP